MHKIISSLIFAHKVIYSSHPLAYFVLIAFTFKAVDASDRFVGDGTAGSQKKTHVALSVQKL